jgi:hypothetical protein
MGCIIEALTNPKLDSLDSLEVIEGTEMSIESRFRLENRSLSLSFFWMFDGKNIQGGFCFMKYRGLFSGLSWVILLD